MEPKSLPLNTSDLLAREKAKRDRVMDMRYPGSREKWIRDLREYAKKRANL